MKIFIADIVRHTAAMFGITPQDIYGQSRKRVFTVPRHVVCFLARELASPTTRGIARGIGRSDHSTVIHGRASCINMMQRDPIFRAKVRRIRKQLKRRGQVVTGSKLSGRRVDVYVPRNLILPKTKASPSVREIYMEALKARDFDEIEVLSRAVAAYYAVAA